MGPDGTLPDAPVGGPSASADGSAVAFSTHAANLGGSPAGGAERQVGRATSGAWSPLLKQNLALASVQSRHSAPGTRLSIEVTVEFERKHVSATVVKTPVFDPERKRATPGPESA